MALTVGTKVAKKVAFNILDKVSTEVVTWIINYLPIEKIIKFIHKDGDSHKELEETIIHNLNENTDNVELQRNIIN